jgi:glutathione S-transferase
MFFAPKAVFATDAEAFEAQRPEIEAYLKAFGEKVKALRAGRKFLVSDEPTYADFIGYEFCYMVKHYNAALLEEAGLQDFMGSMEALENAAAYKEKNDSLIFFGIFAKWNFP